MSRKRLFHTLTGAAAIILITCLAVFFISGAVRIRSAEKPRIVTSGVSGQASVLRRGAGYRLKEDIGLVETDGVITAPGSSAAFSVAGGGSIILDENSEIKIIRDSEECVCIGSVYGTVVCIADPTGTLLLMECPAGSLSAEGPGLYSVETFHGTQTVKVYRGKVTLTSDALEEDKLLLAGQQLVIIQNDDGICSFEEVKPIAIQSLSGFLMDTLLTESGDTFFSREELEAEILRREREVEQARREREEYEAAVIARGGTVPVVESVSPLPEYMTEADIHTCTITIVCDTILDNIGDLTEGKNVYVPENGVILATSKVQYVAGESVYDVLKRVCAAADIPLQYSWTVEFGGYYIEGINNLCEFDCGPESGWMYKVNGWYPNYGSSNYILKEGDIIVWAYTCRGLGKDLGVEWEM